MNKQENEHGAVNAAPQETAEAPVKEAPAAQKPLEADYVAPTGRNKPSGSAEKPVQGVDYVAPAQSFKEHMKNPAASRTHSGGTKTASKEEMAEASEGFVFMTPYRERVHHHHHRHHSSSSSPSDTAAERDGGDLVDPTKLPPRRHRSSSASEDGSSKKRRRKKPLWLRILIIALIVLLCLAIALAGTFFVLREIGRRDLHNYDDIVIVTPTEEKDDEEVVEIMDVIDSGRTVVYEGSTYTFNENIVSFAVIGIDHDIENSYVQSMGDSINIVALDTENGALSVIAVSRDTMADVNLYSDEGAYIDTERLQLAYAYSFGNSHVSGGENTLSALRKLFFGLPLDNYFAINMDALTTLNDAVGGVTLTSSMDFTSKIDGSYISAGDSVTLYGKDAEQYIRSRDKEKLDSNNSRMQRQQEYIRAFISQVIPMVKKDFSLVSRLYDIVQVNSDSTLDLPKITYLASTMLEKMKGAPEISYYSIGGKIVEGQYAELIPDDRSILEAMLKVFYTKTE